MDEAQIKQLDDLIVRTLQRAKETSGYEELKRRGEALREWLHMYGAVREPGIIAVGKKQ